MQVAALYDVQPNDVHAVFRSVIRYGKPNLVGVADMLELFEIEWMSKWIAERRRSRSQQLTRLVKAADHKQRRDVRGIAARRRVEVLARDRACQLCGAGPDETVLHVDHIVPVSRGGLSDLSNLRVLCARCNLGKGASMVAA